MKLEGLVLTPEGQLVRHEFKGPPDHVHWRSCFNVFATAMIMLGACLPAPLTRYADFICRAASRYGAKCWPLIYQTETRFRREHLDRMRRAELRLVKTALAEGRTPSFDPAKPCDVLFTKALTETAYWNQHLTEPCLLVVSGAQAAGNFLEGDCPVAKTETHIWPRTELL